MTELEFLKAVESAPAGKRYEEAERLIANQSESSALLLLEILDDFILNLPDENLEQPDDVTN